MVHPLTFMCITKAEAFSHPFLEEMSRVAKSLDAWLVIGADGHFAAQTLQNLPWHRKPEIVMVQSQGYLESVHDLVLGQCMNGYVLRLDDDEKCSVAMKDWLRDRLYTVGPHWKFPRAHVIGDQNTVILHPQLWPDHQTRLSLKQYAGGRSHIHAGSPHGGGVSAPVVIEHHKFLVKSLQERRLIAMRYDSIQMGAGTGGMLAFNCPEDCVWEPRYGALGDGTADRIGL